MAATPEHAARVLGLSLMASVEDVRQVRRKMALKYHPDCCKDQALSTRHMARINAAADTLTAHIKKQTAPRQQGPSPEAPRRAAHKKAAAPSPRAKATSHRSSDTKPKPDQPQQTSRRPAQRQDAPAAENAAKPQPAAAPADIALIRFAKTSYTHVLDRIGRKETGPTIDVSVLNFQGAH